MTRENRSKEAEKYAVGKRCDYCNHLLKIHRLDHTCPVKNCDCSIIAVMNLFEADDEG